MSWLSHEVDKFGTPGKDTFHDNPYTLDPNAFQNQYLTDDAGTLGSQANLEQQYAGAGNAPGSAGFNAAQAGYGGLETNLQQLASGAPGTSIAQNQLSANTAHNNSNAYAQAVSTQGGGNPALAARNAQLAQGANNLNATNEAATAGIQEREAANTALAQAYGAQGAQGIEEQNAVNSARAGITGQAMGAQQNQLGANEYQQALASSNYNAAQGINANTAGYNAQNNANLFTGATNALGAVASDLGIKGLAEGGVTDDAGGALKAFAAGYGHLDAPKDDGSNSTPSPPAAVKGIGGGGGGSSATTGGGALTGSEQAAMHQGVMGGAAGAGAGAGDVGAIGADAGSVAAEAAPLMLAAAHGAVVPGKDHGQDERPYLLRPNEVVTPPESPIHPYVKAAQLHPGFAHAMAAHMRTIIGRAAGGAVVPPRGAPLVAGFNDNPRPPAPSPAPSPAESTAHRYFRLVKGTLDAPVGLGGGGAPRTAGFNDTDVSTPIRPASEMFDQNSGGAG